MVFAPALAYDLLVEPCQRMGVALQTIPGIVNRYKDDKSFDVWGTVADVVPYALELPHVLSRVEEVVRRERPDLVVTDFEPILPRAAARCDVSFISVNHQHLLVVADLSELPADLRWHAAVMSVGVRALYSGQVHTVVSAFYPFKLKRPYLNQVTHAGVFLRPAVKQAATRVDDHLAVYLRRGAPSSMLDALDGLGLPARVYGLPERGRRGKLEFLPVDADVFADDLASARALVTTAGNQIVGEALYHGKPVFALPEPKNYEQYVNAHHLAKMGAGDWLPIEECRTEHLRDFLKRFEPAPRHHGSDGTSTAVRCIERELRGQSTPAWEKRRFPDAFEFA